ncbi:GTPase IMAP family member 8-like protein [Lates japonicus]|uniref:GTPase IMAP family member 8-like protein n=1 Tax=Lates japonicus TaxID=270547 RepID=A0AAD3NEK1_LATJO|nr:GTPase IMAP family member 8-like protein [Lates japonicus]
MRMKEMKTTPTSGRKLIIDPPSWISLFSAEFNMASAAPDGDLNSLKCSSNDYFRPDLCELRVILLGNQAGLREFSGNFICTGETEFNTEEEADCCQRSQETGGGEKPFCQHPRSPASLCYL